MASLRFVYGFFVSSATKISPATKKTVKNLIHSLSYFFYLCNNMSNINCTQVQSTNDASTVSKCSAVSKNYFEDDFIGEFVDKKKSRASLIHLGYYTRAVILNTLILKFIKYLKLKNVLKFQIISCGSGFDTTFWRLSKANLLNDKTIFIEIDFPAVIQRKVSLIQKSEKLKSYLCEGNDTPTFGRIWMMNCNYFLVEADLSDIQTTQKLLTTIRIDFDLPTLFLSECVITYMKDQDSDKLIEWMAGTFKNCAFINYEQIHPEDGFGEVMLRHFNKLSSPLHSVTKYPDCRSHYGRYRSLGFENSFAVSEWDALLWLTTEEERRKKLSLEVFDEFEEFHLKCVHYVVAVAGNGISSCWIDSFFYKSFTPETNKRECFIVKELKSNFELCRHFSCNAEGNIYFFGGCNRQSRSSNIYKINDKRLLDMKTVDALDYPEVQTDIVYGTVVYFTLDEQSYVCIYGGRTSPNKITNNGSIVVFQLVDDQFVPRLTTTEGNPIPRYRSTMVSFNPTENEAECWIFGGRTPDLNQSLSDLWQLKIRHDSEKRLSYLWKGHKRENANWPCSRMSHSSLACPERRELFISGGFNVDSSSVLNDIWKWCCESESWQKMELIGKLLPRYGHTSHLKDDVIYLVGGVNTLAGMQPGLATVDLNTLIVTEYAMPSYVAYPILLFNHTSQLICDGKNIQILVFGGGGNCFSFGTHLNRGIISVRLP